MAGEIEVRGSIGTETEHFSFHLEKLVFGRVVQGIQIGDGKVTIFLEGDTEIQMSAENQDGTLPTIAISLAGPRVEETVGHA